MQVRGSRSLAGKLSCCLSSHKNGFFLKNISTYFASAGQRQDVHQTVSIIVVQYTVSTVFTGMANQLSIPYFVLLCVLSICFLSTAEPFKTTTDYRPIISRKILVKMCHRFIRVNHIQPTAAPSTRRPCAARAGARRRNEYFQASCGRVAHDGDPLASPQD